MSVKTRELLKKNQKMKYSEDSLTQGFSNLLVPRNSLHLEKISRDFFKKKSLEVVCFWSEIKKNDFYQKYVFELMNIFFF
jgi:hypothetical protein